MQYHVNPAPGPSGVVVLPEAGFRRAWNAITAWEGYAPTPLRDLPALAEASGVATVRLKDEGGRFGLGSFKALGGAYAVEQAVAADSARRGPAERVVTSATDGNHGRAVAWGARRVGCRAVIFIHAAVSPGREAAIAALGAEVRRVPGTYDDAVRACAATAAAEGWLVISDTSWPGYTEVPRAIMQGYRVMVAEAAAQWAGPPPTHVFIQCGVGGVGAAVAAQSRAAFTPAPALVVVEAEAAACLLLSARAGRAVTAPGKLETVMAGLACGEPSLLAWQALERAAAAFVAVPDRAAVAAMRALAAAGVVAGESGAAGAAGLAEVAADPVARAALGLGADSRVLLFGTEGATDPVLYAELVGGEYRHGKV
ncbi:MAG: diaminopropionate ammonia-lyase [Acetobacteraceae bacterium]